MGYGKFADRHGLPDTFLYFGCGSWIAAFLIAFLLYLTYPKEYHQLREQDGPKEGFAGEELSRRAAT